MLELIAEDKNYMMHYLSYPADCQMLQNYELLLQIDSDEDSDGENVIMWGDFSRVYYNWDCG